jgi:hypothetical protein
MRGAVLGGSCSAAEGILAISAKTIAAMTMTDTTLEASHNFFDLGIFTPDFPSDNIALWS